MSPIANERDPLRLQSDMFNFAIFWVGTFILSFVLLSPIFEIIRFFIPALNGAANEITLGIIILILGLLSSLGQHWSLRYATNKWFTRWWQMSFLGWLIGGALAISMTAFLESVNQSVLTLQILTILFPVTLMQFIILRRYVYDAWLWLIATLAAAAVAAPMLEIMTGAIAGVLAFAAYSTVTSLIMFRLLRNTAIGKRKRKQHADDNILSEAASHLQDVNADDLARNQQRHDEQKRSNTTMHRW